MARNLKMDDDDHDDDDESHILAPCLSRQEWARLDASKAWGQTQNSKLTVAGNGAQDRVQRGGPQPIGQLVIRDRGRVRQGDPTVMRCQVDGISARSEKVFSRRRT